jgi:ATP-dependent exoDNAse (exonuclease V) alpha subunit
MSSEDIKKAVEAARAQLAMRNMIGKLTDGIEKADTLLVPETRDVMPLPKVMNQWEWNAEQRSAINNGIVGRNFCLIGAAGTGKTTTLRGMIKAKLDAQALPMLKEGTQHLRADAPGIALISYTRRAVRNIARNMPPELRPHCLTYHKLLEFAPEQYYDVDDEGKEVRKMRFVPTKHRLSPLPAELKMIIVDEASMPSIELHNMLLEALPHASQVQFVFVGDLNQLPPVYGNSILGKALLEFPIVELTQVYRQALESPIIALALAVKNNNFAQFNKDAVDLWTGDKFRKEDGKPNYMAFDAKNVDPKKLGMKTISFEKPGRGKVTLHPWSKKTETEVGLAYMQGQLKAWIDDGTYNPDEDMVLCPWDKSFGAKELNYAIADKLGKKRNAEVFEIIAGFNKYYYAVGDRIIVDKNDAVITTIRTNGKYLGKRPANPSTKMDRWGNHADRNLALSDFEGLDVDELLESLGDVEDRVEKCSHVIGYRLIDTDEEGLIETASELNSTSFGYAMTVHKAQGSECRKVFFLTHYCHSAMCFRELVYTAITRAAEELYIVMSPMMLQTAGNRARIKGDNLKAKLEFFSERLKERQDGDS